MKIYKLRIIVPGNTDRYNKYIYDSALSVIPANVDLDIRNIKGGSESIENRYNLMQNSPYLIDAVKEAEKDKIDGIFVSDMDFCGVEVAREITDIPIIGGFRPSGLTAVSLGQKFSIITILDSIKDYQIEHVRAFGLETSFASIRAVEIPVDELIGMYTNPEYKKKVIERVGEIGLKTIKEDGADVIMFGCTGFVDIAEGVHQYIYDKGGYDVPVLDPNKTAINFLYTIVSNNLKQSRQTYAKII